MEKLDKEIQEDLIRELRNRVEELDKKVSKFEETGISLNSRIGNNETRLRERDTIEEALLHGERITGTTNASAGTISEHTHTLNRTPTMVFITSKGNGVVYLTAKDSDKITVKSSANSIDFVAYLLI